MVIKIGVPTYTRSIVYHETTSAHVYSSLTRKIRQSSLPLIPLITAKKKEEVLINREIVKQLIEITIFLGRHNMVLEDTENINTIFVAISLICVPYYPNFHQLWPLISVLKIIKIKQTISVFIHIMA